MNERCVTRKMSLSIRPRDMLQQADDLTTPIATLHRLQGGPITVATGVRHII
jgi:hypothetical protein